MFLAMGKICALLKSVNKSNKFQYPKTSIKEDELTYPDKIIPQVNESQQYYDMSDLMMMNKLIKV
jgi:hypothetical protein